jgi:phosphatidylglycerophosphate synthase
MKDIWITFGPVLLINVILVISLIAFTVTKHSRVRDIHEAASRTSSKYLSLHLREWWVWTTDPIARFFMRIGIGPNALSMIGFMWSAAAAVLFAKGLFGYAGWSIIFGGTFDIFDGRVARLSGQECRSGAYFDSVIDRFGEGVCFLGLAYYFRSSWIFFLVVAGLVGSMMVSYTKARAQSMGVPCDVGAMQRPERIVYLGVSSILTPVTTLILALWWTSPLPVLVIGALVIIALGTNGTAIYRMVHTMNQLDITDERDRESVPRIIARLATPEGREALWERARYGYDRTKSRFSSVAVFVVDGLQGWVVDNLVQRGDLPNLSRHVIERGAMGRAVTAFPSTTGPDFTPFVTGCFPGTCGVPGAQWFDRSIPEGRLITMNRFRDYLGWGAYAMDYDLSKTVQTIFEYSKRAVNIFGMVNRGCGLIRDPAFFRLYSMFSRAKEKRDLDAIFQAANLWFTEALKRESDFILYAMPPVESTKRGEISSSVVDSYRKVDEAVGKAVDQLKSHGVYEKTAIVFAGGHGRSIVESRFDLNSFFKERYKLFTHPGKPREWLEAQAITAMSGSSMMHLYLKNNGSWAEECFLEDIEQRGLVGALLEKPEVDILAGRSVEGGVIAISRRGRAHIVEDPDGRLTYLIKGGDPFGYGPLPQVMKSNEALSHTFESEYPDGIMQVSQIFRSKRAGDLVISANHGCDIRDVEGRSGGGDTHGSLHAEHMLVPCASSVPFSANRMRTADVFSLCLDSLGIEATHQVDGVNPSLTVPEDKSDTRVGNLQGSE